MSKEIHPEISVLMSVFNGEQHLEEAIISVLNQSFKKFELIIIDDGSTDSTAEILNHCNDFRIKVVTQSNQGLTYSLNQGISLMKGRFMARLDADDLCHPDRLSRQFAEMQRRPDLALLGTWAIQIDDAGKELVRNRLPVGMDAIRSMMTVSNPFVHGSMMLRKSALDATSGYREAFRFAQDYDLALRLGEHNEMDNLPEYLYFSRHTIGMVSVKHNSQQHVYAQLARTLHVERQHNEIDALQRGMAVEELLPDTELDDAGEIKYYQHLISMKCRQSEIHEVRMAVAALLRIRPVNPKLWAIGLATFLGPAVLRWLTRTWDKR